MRVCARGGWVWFGFPMPLPQHPKGQWGIEERKLAYRVGAWIWGMY